MDRKKSENISTAILLVAIIVIFSVTVYFCLDIFEIIEVPEKYSLVDLLASKTEFAISSESADSVRNEIDNINKTDNQKDKSNDYSEDFVSNNEYDNVLPPDFNNYISTESIEGDTTKFETKKSLNVQNKYYYNQLDIYAKLIYDELYRNLDELKTGLHKIDFNTTFNDLLHEENGAEILERDFQLAVNALTFDKPEVFFLDISKMYLFTEITTFGPKQTFRVSIGSNNSIPYLGYGFSSKNDINIVEAELNAIAQSCIQSGGNIYEKIKNVHDYLVNEISYDETLSKTNIYNIYGALKNKEAVCEGYAKAFKFILDKMEIPCIIACGTAVNSRGTVESHAWNYVSINDIWYAVDVTWDDPVIIGSGNATNEIRYHYFLNGSQEFFKDHYEEGTLIGDYVFKYPELSLTNY